MRLRYKDITVQQLRSFREVCRQQNYSSVARQFQLSTSAIWEQMRALERYFEAELLENQGGKIVTTADGERLLELISPVLSGLESTKQTLQELRGKPPERIVVVSGMRMLTEEISLAVAEFHRHQENVCVQLKYVADTKIDTLVEAGEADFGVVLERSNPRESHAVVHERGYELDYILVTPKKHSLATKKTLRLSELTNHPLIVGVPGTASRDRVEQIFQRHELRSKARIVAETNSSALTIACVRAGVGIGIAAGHLKGPLTNGLAVRSLEKWFGRAHYGFVWRKGAHITPAVKQLADFIRAHV